MNKLTKLFKTVIVIVLSLVGVNLWAQDPAPAALSGTGTSADPYQITCVADWNAFAEAVNGGYDYSGKHVQLEADIPSEVEILEGTPALTTMVGVWDAEEANRKPFKGTFKGNGKTIIVSYTSSADNYTAPFRCTNGATITNDLTIVGNIDATNGYAAGAVGINYGSKTKINGDVTVRVNITGGGTHCGGFAVDATYLEMSSCLYNGQIIVGDYSAGYCAAGDENTKFNKCIFDPAAGSSITGTNTGNYINGSYNTANSNNYYYTNEAPTASTTQGVCIYKSTSYDDIPDDKKFRMLTNLAGNYYYYVEGTCEISGIESLYYQNNAQHGGITYDVLFNLPGDPAAVVAAECYTADVLNGSGDAVDVSTIAPGTYTLRITGKEGYCSGFVTSDSFTIVETIFDHGTGTEDKPYQIWNKADWNKFAQAVNAGHSFAGEYLILKTSDIVITITSASSDKMAGVVTSGPTEDKWFSGTFDGNWNTLTFNVGTSSAGYDSGNDYSPNAPFRVIDGATIKNLTVEGTIYSVRKYSAGLVGFAYNSKTSKVNNIRNCTSNIFFYGTYIDNGGNGTGTGNKRFDCSAAGFVAENKTGKIYFNNCIFNGEIVKGGDNYANRGAGFVSYNNGGTVYFTNCTMAGKIGLDYAGTFYRASNARHEYSNCYYVTRPANQNQEQFDADNCKQAYTNPSDTDLTNKIYKCYNINSTNYYIPSAEISGFETTTYSAGETITIPAPTVTYYGRTLTRGTDYVIKKKFEEGEYVQVDGAITLTDAGDYDLKIEAKAGSNYGGSQTTTINVIAFSSWAIVQEYLADASKGDRIITLSGDIKPTSGTDHYLAVNGNVVLNLNGKTIDRDLDEKTIYGQVIRVNAGANLTINGPGTITGGNAWVGPTADIPAQESTYYDKRDGGGIHNMGNLVLNNVDVTYNIIYKDVANSQKPVARGGGIYSGLGSSLIINGGSVSSNTGEGGGGGIYCDKAKTFEMTGVDVHTNSADSKGGGLRIKTTGSTIAYLTDCDISEWNAVSADASQGGGIYLESGELVMTGCTIVGNATTMQGGGFFSYSGKTTAIDCTIEYNGTYYYESNVNHGGGICLYDNKGSNHSIYIMDGGVIRDNNCSNDGGGVYIYEGAVFQVKGNVQIYDNLQASMEVGLIGNSNAYLAGDAVIEVVGPLDDDAIITITPHDGGGTYVTFAEGAESPVHSEDLSHFVLDTEDEGEDDYGSMIDNDGNVVVYEVTSWDDTDTWDGTIATNLSGSLPTSDNDVIINRAVKIPDKCTALAKDITLGTYGSIILEEGGQLENNNAVAVKAKKGVEQANAENNTGWYLISSPVANPSIADNTNLITKTGHYEDPSYDLYRFNEAAELQWENYRAHSTGAGAIFTTLENGRGYLYRNKYNHTIEIDGTLNVDNITYSLSFAGTNELKGFNIIGNPYSHNITKGDANANILNEDLLEEKYYVLEERLVGEENVLDWYLNEDGSAIPPMTGVLVQAKKAGDVTITNILPKPEAEPTPDPSKGAKKVEKRNLWFTVANSSYMDEACVEFKEGHGLNKIERMNENAPMLYVNYNGEDFASVDMNPEEKAFDLYFEAKTTGRYTLSVKPQGEYSYLHLIDKVAGEDIDLLKDDEYTFIGMAGDNANRFIVRMESSESPENSTFAYQTGNEIVVEGEGELQVFDVTGRKVATQHVNGVGTWHAASVQNGVYILKMGDKTQKIVIR